MLETLGSPISRLAHRVECVAALQRAAGRREVVDWSYLSRCASEAGAVGTDRIYWGERVAVAACLDVLRGRKRAEWTSDEIADLIASRLVALVRAGIVGDISAAIAFARVQDELRARGQLKD